MATSVYETQTVKLFSGKEISVRPLKISLLRKFMVKFDEMIAVANNNTDSMDLLIECVAIAMQQYDPDLSDNKELLEDELDLPTAYKIIEVAAGIKLGDENPQMGVPSGQT